MTSARLCWEMMLELLEPHISENLFKRDERRVQEMPEYILGVRGHDYGKGKVKEILSRIKQDGWECTQLAFKKLVAGVTSYADVTPEVVAEVLDAIKETQLDVAVLGTYVELGALDTEKRKKDVADFISQITVCKALGASCIASETTYFDGTHATVTREEALRGLLKSLDVIMPEAERQGVMVALEPVRFHTMNTVETTRMVIDHVKSPNLKIIFDPANLLSPEWLNRQDELYQRAVESWGGLITAVHFKGLHRIEEGYYPCSLQDSVVDYKAVFDALKVVQHDRLPLLREEAVPELAKQDQEFIKQFFV